MSEGWYAMRTLCVICLHEWVAVFPAAADPARLECSRCHAQHSMVLADQELAEHPDPADQWKRGAA